MNGFSTRLQNLTLISAVAFVVCAGAARLPRSVGARDEAWAGDGRDDHSWIKPSSVIDKNSGTLKGSMLTMLTGVVKGEQRSKEQPGHSFSEKKEQQMLLMCGYPLPAWVVAVSVCLSASVLTVLGFVLQKKGANAPGDHWTIGDVVLSKEWISGFILIVCAGFPLDLLAYSLAPMSLTTPLSGVTVALNMALAPRLLGEVVQSWPDAAATGLIVGGTLITTASGAHEEPVYTSQRLWELLGNPLMRGCLFVLLSAISACIGILIMWRKELALSAMRRPLNPNVLEVLLPSFVAGAAGCLTNIALKAVGVLLRASGPGIEIFTWTVFVIVPAVVQLNYLNRGLQLYPQTVFLPIYTAILVLLSTIVGAIFYQEHEELMAQPRWQHLFVLGVCWIVGGISLFTFREPDACDAATIALQNTHAKGAPTDRVAAPPLLAEQACGEAQIAG